MYRRYFTNKIHTYGTLIEDFEQDRRNTNIKAQILRAMLRAV